MKRCLCRAFIDNPIEREMFCNDLRALGHNPMTHGHQVYVDFEDAALLQATIDLFDQFEYTGYFVEF